MTSRPGFYTAAQVPDMERRAAEAISIGIVEEVDYSNRKKPRVRVRIGKNVSDWLPWSSGRAGGNVDWEPLDKGEQVSLIAPSGDLSQAVIVGSYHKEGNEAPDFAGPDVTGRQWKDGTQQTYDREKHAHTVKVPHAGGAYTLEIGSAKLVIHGDGRVVLDAPAGVEFNTPKLNVSGDVVAAGVSLIEHTHTGVRAGSDTSGPPVGAGSAGGGLGAGGTGSAAGGAADPSGVAGWSAPSSPGTSEEEAINGVPVDAMGLYRGAIFTRPEFGLGNALTAEKRARLLEIGWYEINGYNQGRIRIPSIQIPFPADQIAIPESTFFERVRLSVSRAVDGEYIEHAPKPSGSTRSYVRTGEVLVSRKVGEAWTDEVISRRWGPNEVGRKELGAYGLWNGPIPAGILPEGTPTLTQPDSPNSPSRTCVFEFPLSVFKSKSGVLFVEAGKYYNQIGDGFGVSTSDFPIYWEITEAELLENGEVL